MTNKKTVEFEKQLTILRNEIDDIDSQLVGLGHGVMIAPSNAGKTTLANFLASAAIRFGVMIFIFDRNFASKIFTKVCGGTYVALDNVLNPLLVCKISS